MLLIHNMLHVSSCPIAMALVVWVQLNHKVNFQHYECSSAWEQMLYIWYKKWHFFSPLPQAAHIRVSWVQRVAQTNQEAQQQQDGGALQSHHGPEG